MSMKCEERFFEIYGGEPEGLSFSPYRVCPIGAHVDHNLGKVTGFAIDKGIHIAYRAKKSGVVEMTSLQFPKRAQWHIASVPKEKQNGWADYLRGATWALGKRYPLRVGMRYYEPETARLLKSGVSKVDESERLLSMEEKPETPKSNWCTPPFYFYKKADVARIKDAIADGCGTDAPGSLVAWMCDHSILHSMEMPGSRYDIGNLESYRRVQETYRGITK